LTIDSVCEDIERTVDRRLSPRVERRLAGKGPATAQVFLYVRVSRGETGSEDLKSLAPGPGLKPVSDYVPAKQGTDEPRRVRGKLSTTATAPLRGAVESSGTGYSQFIRPNSQLLHVYILQFLRVSAQFRCHRPPKRLKCRAESNWRTSCFQEARGARWTQTATQLTL
jgi:hypothetical protein